MKEEVIATTINTTATVSSDLVTIDSTRNVPMTTSLKVAEVFGKSHFNVMRDIDALDCSPEFRELNFEVSSYKPDGAKRSYPMYLMTRDGFTFLAMGFTGARAAEFKEKYIAEFNRMEADNDASPRLFQGIPSAEFSAVMSTNTTAIVRERQRTVFVTKKSTSVAPTSWLPSPRTTSATSRPVMSVRL